MLDCKRSGSAQTDVRRGGSRFCVSDEPAIEGSLFCITHTDMESSGGSVPSWLKKLISDVSAKTAVLLVWEIWKEIPKLPGLGAATKKEIQSLAARLEREMATQDESSMAGVLQDVQEFFERNEDVRYRDFINAVLRKSGNIVEIGEVLRSK